MTRFKGIKTRLKYEPTISRNYSITMTRFKGIKTILLLLLYLRKLLYSITMTRFKGIKTSRYGVIYFNLSNSITMTRFKGIKTQFPISILYRRNA